MSSPERHDVAIVGAGFGGLAMTHRLAEAGIDAVAIFERRSGVGGTWLQNSYPGAACDVPSHLYSLSFAPNPDWSRMYAQQPEILAYIERCYDEFDVRRKVRCSTEIIVATWDDRQQVWRLRDRAGKTYEASVFIPAMGMFHTPATPDLPGLADFAGDVVHSARWDRDQVLAGRQVAVIGTGASAIQVVPAIATDLARLDVYQRTPAWILPRQDPPFSAEQRSSFAQHPELAAELRQQIHDLLEQSMTFIAGAPSAAVIEQRAREYLADAVSDPELRARLTPDYPIGCKRILVSSDFYPAIQQPHVEVVTEHIEQILPFGIRTSAGIERPADTLILCTGFEATNYLNGIEVVGRGERNIHDHWAGRPRAYHGMAVPGFPNLFMMYGPNTNQGGNSIILILEAQAAFIASAIVAMLDGKIASLEVTEEATAQYSDELELALAATVWGSGCNSYFRNAAGDIVTQLPHTSTWYRQHTAGVQMDDFRVSAASEPSARLGE